MESHRGAFVAFVGAAVLMVHIGLLAGRGRADDERPPRKLADGDRVVLLGGGVIEQQRLHCCLETRLLRHHPREGLVIRNLGWGGDTVRGAARTAGFDTPEGLARLVKEVAELKPTVIFLGYGMNESFAGAAGLSAFVRDYEALLDKLGPLKARTILLSPTYHEPLGPPHPDATPHNQDLQAYSGAVKELARKRKLDFIDLFGAMKQAKEAKPERLLTTNGIQPNAAGYAVIARAIEAGLGYSDIKGWRVAVSAKGVVEEAVGVKATVEKAKAGLGLTIQADALAVADPVGKEQFFLAVAGLPEGMHVLQADGKEIVRATAIAWQRGVSVPALDQAGEKLRQALIVNNDLFYRRWRPFNDHSRHVEFLKPDFALYDKAIAEQERTIRAMLPPPSYFLSLMPLEKPK